MTGTELKTLATTFLGGSTPDDDFFYPYINMVKNLFESSRDWMILRTFDNSITFTASDDYTSTKSLPSRFLRVYTSYDSRNNEQPGVYIVESNGSKVPLKPISFADRYNYKDVDGYYYIDLKNSKIGRTGTKAGTLHLFFLQGTVDIDADIEWSFPEFIHPYLPYLLAMDYKGGIDWDTVNANQVPYNQVRINQILSAANMWDSRLQLAELGV